MYDHCHTGKHQSVLIKSTKNLTHLQKKSIHHFKNNAIPYHMMGRGEVKVQIFTILRSPDQISRLATIIISQQMPALG